MWRLTGTNACWEAGPFRAHVDVACPQRGITGLAWNRQVLTDVSLMQMHVQCHTHSCVVHLEDCYVRGADLIARYADANRQVVFPEYYWRIRHDANACHAVTMESLLSVHTQLLDSDPEVTVQCVMPADGYHVWHEPEMARMVFGDGRPSGRTPIDVTAAGCAVVWQSATSPVAFGQLVHPADVSHAEVSCDPTSRLVTSRISYFRGKLEKGVIRRARLRGVLTEGDGARQVLADQWHDLLQSPPPLAT